MFEAGHGVHREVTCCGDQRAASNKGEFSVWVNSDATWSKNGM
jgi:hypothetical protein